MRAHILNIFLAITLLLLTACSQKTVKKTVHTDFTSYTIGDYEMVNLMKELNTTLALPIQNTLFEHNLTVPLDEVTLIKEKHNTLRIILNSALFEPNHSIPIANALNVVEELTNVLKKYPHVIVQVSGYTDVSESMKNHQDLSDNRAISIAEILYRLESRHETYAKGCADKNPLYPITNNKSKLSNARVEIYLYPNKSYMKDQCH